METTLRRLYVGGLSPSVTNVELLDKFGRFGEVDEVDIICRKDDQGNPMRTFAYINILISDTDLKKCLSLLNKTKWKGGVLHIEIAKESFLHRLELERQEAKEQWKPRAQSNPKTDLLKSLEKAGVTDFQMKAAVPGTEVPNHKNWVVSKYGRVLPVLHLKESKESKIIKYDPSKYCHNVKKLDNVSHEMTTPVAELTWHLDGGDDDISRKRRGEFPEFKTPVKKSKVSSYTWKTDESERYLTTSQATLQKAGDFIESQHKGEKSRGYMGNISVNSMYDEYDSEEELRALIEREKLVTAGRRLHEDEHIEVVNDTFTPKYKTHWAEEIGDHRANGNAKDDYESDSADTDEIITVARTSQNCRIGETESNSILKQKSNVASTDFGKSKCHVNQEDSSTDEEDDDLSNDSEDSSESSLDEECKLVMLNCALLDAARLKLRELGDFHGEEMADTDIIVPGARYVRRGIKGEHEGSVGDQSTKKDKCKASHTKDLGPGDCIIEHSSGSRISHSENGSVRRDPSVRKGNSPGKKVSESSSHDDDDDDDDTDVTSEDEKAETRKGKSKNAAANGNLKRKKGIEPEDIVASILEEDDSSNDESKLEKKIPLARPPAFKGLGSLMSSAVSVETKAPVSCTESCGHPRAVGNKTNATLSEGKGQQDSKKKEERPPKTDKKASTDTHQKSESHGSSGEESGSDEETSFATSPIAKPQAPQKCSSEGQPNARTKQLQDNQKRLAAMEERRKEREQQKQAIQGALLNLDSQTAKKSHHIVFDSESEEESEKEDASTSKVHNDKKANPIKAKLFDSSGEDSDDEEENDDERFEIKTQYEGRSGEKLMALQSRFGTDERFKMDSRFLEDASDGEQGTEPQKIQAEDDHGLSAEKKKNLDILQSVLNINMQPQPTTKQAAKAKTFKDLNALQYDPTKEDHAVFETTRAEEEKKESKAERKKKRLEAEKLPEVSKEIFHEVSLDFKEVFGAPKPQAREEPETTWDKVEETQKMELENLMSNVELGFQKTEEPAGFTFSFFGRNTEVSRSQDEPYKIETIKAAKVGWQEDPRFQDSSSEEEEAEEDTTPTAADTSSNSERSVRYFFFAKDDARLKEGPKTFLRSSEQMAKEWELLGERIMEVYKKRHRDAQKKLKSKQ